MARIGYTKSFFVVETIDLMEAYSRELFSEAIKHVYRVNKTDGIRLAEELLLCDTPDREPDTSPYNINANQRMQIAFWL